MKVGLIGSTNVGKSTLFNSLIGNHRAIVTAVHGTTRDILYEPVQRSAQGSVLHHHTRDEEGEQEQASSGPMITFLDTPGLDTFDEEIPYIEQVIAMSDVLFFVIDAEVGMGAKEQDIYKRVSAAHKKGQTILIVNKLEKAIGRGEVDIALADYWGMGCEDVRGISAKNNKGLDALKTILWDKLQDYVQQSVDDLEVDDETIPLAIIGKPNAGKSTLLNQLLGEDRALVSDIPGTTLDYNVGSFEYEGQSYRLYDTAGIRKKGKTQGLERIAYKKTLSMLHYVRPVVLMMIDIDAGITHRDMSLLGEILQMHLPVIIAGNKIDLLSASVQKQRMEQLVAYIDFAKYIPIIPLSAEEGTGVKKLFQTVMGVWDEYEQRVPTAELNTLVARQIIQRPPRFPKNKVCKLRYISQVDTKPPTFQVSVNNKKYANFAFKKRLENTIRMQYGFVGIPLKIKLKDQENPYTKK